MQMSQDCHSLTTYVVWNMQMIKQKCVNIKSELGANNQGEIAFERLFWSCYKSKALRN